MIEIFVTSYNGRPPAAELTGWFGPEGGTLGRGADNRLVLPDPARHVSRVQARIRFDGSGFFIANISEANPLFLNDTEIDSGSEVPLEEGAELRIGLYVLGVRRTGAATSAGPAARSRGDLNPAPMGAQADPLAGLGGSARGPNPFEDLLGSENGSATPPPAMRPVPEAPRAAMAGSRGSAPRQEPRIEPKAGTAPSGNADPFADVLRPSPTPSSGTRAPLSPASDPFADLMQGTAGSAMPLRPAVNAPDPARNPPRAGGIPDDFDPFALPSSAPRNTDDPLRDLASSSIDLNAVGAQQDRSSLLEFDLARNANPRDPLQGGTPSLVDSQGVVDPLRLFDGNDDTLHAVDNDPLGRGMPMPDKVAEIGSHFTPPRSVPEHPARAAASIPVSADTLKPPAKAQPAPPRQANYGASPSAPGHSSAANLNPREARDARAQPVSPARPAPHPAPVAPPSRAAEPVAGSSPDADALLAAFLKGARVADFSLQIKLTPALMELMGTLVYEATAGAMELIAARKITKHEIRAEVTMIVAHGNNPLKFLPTPEAAILQMLGPKMPGFMTTGEAMQDAFDDLRAHEVGMIAGMRAALAEVLSRFDPAILEKRLGKNALLDTLLPSARRAKLWNLFEAGFHELYREANDDFQSLYGEAFVKAYQEQIENERIRRGRV